MLRTLLLVTGGLLLTAGLLAIAWALLTLTQSPGWRASAGLAVPGVGVGGLALLAAALVAFRISGRTGRPGDPAHAIDAAAEAPPPEPQPRRTP